jgi:hypothetical protein
MESIVSVITGAITNLNIFGLYRVEHIFVHFNYFTSVFRRSYEKFLEYMMCRTMDVSLEKKLLQIPYTLFSEPDGGIMKPLANKKFILVDSFSFGNFLQTFSETYEFRITASEYDELRFVDCQVRNDDGNHDSVNFFRRKEEEKVFLRTFDVISRKGATRTFYVNFSKEEEYQKTKFKLGK